MKRFFKSLQAKYMLIILMAIFLVQVTMITIAMIVSGIVDNIGDPHSSDSLDYDEVEEKWHAEAQQLQNISQETIHQYFTTWKKQFPEASMFWVDEHGFLVEQMDVGVDLPHQWTAVFTAKFIKERYDRDPFTVIAFVGQDELNGFVVLELPRSSFQPPLQRVYTDYGTILSIGMLSIITLFITVSFLFFRGIRKRLLHLQEAMTIRDADGLPIQTEVKRDDEVGQLEQAFNEMVVELKESRQREREEEQLRRELIANLSHDLRTPLTKVSAQLYSLAKEDITLQAKRAIKTIESSMRDIDRLIENLMSYTLLMASKYKQERKDINVIRYVRESLASWYPAFEKEGFEIVVELTPFENDHWHIDPTWFGRILDNIFQNVLRHAKSGQFIYVKSESTKQYDAIVIIDRGKGMKNVSNEKGAGIGLSIVDMMVKGMELDWEIETSERGTSIKIKKQK